MYEPPLASVEVDSQVLSQEQLLSFLVEEIGGGPARFELTVADPEGVLWQKTESSPGTPVRIQLDAEAPFCGVVYGRRLVVDRFNAGTSLLLWGYDALQQLAAVSRYRVFPAGSARKVLEALVADGGYSVVHQQAIVGRWAAEHNQLVQYGESDLDFLRRLAYSQGIQFWSWRGTFFWGTGPDSSPIALDVTDDTSGVGGVALQEQWFREPQTHLFPRRGTPFTGSPPLNQTEARPVGSQRRTDLEAAIVHQLAPETVHVWPAGLAANGTDLQELAERVSDRLRDTRVIGGVTIHGPPPPGLKPGSFLRLTYGDAILSDRLLVAGLTHQFSGEVRDTVIHIGRVGELPYAPPELRPATHLWSAEVVGPYDSRVASIAVKVLGWAPDSEPLSARILTTSAVPDWGAIHCPEKGELVLIGFEGGNPEAPVVLGSLFDRPAPPTAATDVARWIWRTPQGAITVDLEQRKLNVTLENIELSLQSNVAVAVQTSGADLQLSSSQNVKVTAGNQIHLDKKPPAK